MFSSISIRTSGPITNADICPNVEDYEIRDIFLTVGNYVPWRTHVLAFGGVVKNEMVLNLLIRILQTSP